MEPPGKRDDRKGDDGDDNRKQQRGRQIVGDARRHARHQIGGGGRDHHQIGRAAELDVPDLGLAPEVEQRLAAEAKPRGYLPIDGMPAYDQAVRDLVFGADAKAVAALGRAKLDAEAKELAAIADGTIDRGWVDAALRAKGVI